MGVVPQGGDGRRALVRVAEGDGVGDLVVGAAGQERRR